MTWRCLELYSSASERAAKDAASVAPTDAPRAFADGFVFALERWNAGECVALIQAHPKYDTSAFGRGMFAACEALGGWYDLAASEARKWGFSRDQADTFVLAAREC